MITAPNSFNCTPRIKHIQPDAAIANKYTVSGEILAVEAGAENNVFFAVGRNIDGFTFSIPPQIKPGAVVKVEVEFIGNPFIQNYRLSKFELV